jgi:hypothetical protein
MKMALAVLISLSLAVPGLAAETRVGSDITIDEATAIADILKAPEAFEGKTVRIEGLVTEVCQGSGCWFKVRSGGAEVIAKDPGHKLLVPMDCAGQRAVVQGEVALLPPPKQEQKSCGHDHGDHGDHGDEEKAHVCPNPRIQIRTAGVLLSDQEPTP